MGMAANPSGAHQAGRVFTGRIDRGGVSVCDAGARWHALGTQTRDSVVWSQLLDRIRVLGVMERRCPFQAEVAS